jgi:hypothetical protein
VQIVRGELDGQVSDGATVVRSLTELEARFAG